MNREVMELTIEHHTCLSSHMNIGVIIPAAGRGVRFGSTIPKQYLKLKGTPVIVHTLRTVLSVRGVTSVVVALSSDDKMFDLSVQMSGLSDPRLVTVEGGSERQHSIQAALMHPSMQNVDIILVHDAVRPLATKDLCERVVDAANEHGAVVPARPVSDTIKRVDENSNVVETIPRGELRAVQTPQGFRTEVLRNAYEKGQFMLGTDDASLVEAGGSNVHVIDGEPWNIKVTTPVDLDIADVLMNGTS